MAGPQQIGWSTEAKLIWQLQKALSQMGAGSSFSPYASLAAFPIPGKDNVIYLALDTNFLYYWDSNTSSYVQMGGGGSAYESYASLAAFPPVGDPDVIYLALDTNQIYYWDTGTSSYVEMSGAPASVAFYANVTLFPLAGTAGVIYVAEDTSKIYYWNGSAYVELSAGLTTNYIPVANYAALPVTGDPAFLYITNDTQQVYRWYSGAYVEVSVGVTGSGTAGQVTYWSGTSSVTGSTGFVYDAANTRLGIGKTPGAFTLDIYKEASVGISTTNNNSGSNATYGTIAYQHDVFIRRSGSVSNAIVRLAAFYIGDGTTRRGKYTILAAEDNGAGNAQVNVFSIGNTKFTAIGSGYAGLVNDAVASSLSVANSPAATVILAGSVGAAAQCAWSYSGTYHSAIFNSTNNWGIGVLTDAGFKLDVGGTTRVTGALTVTGSTTAAAGVSRGQYNTSTLVAAANNDTLVAVDIAPTFTNGAFTGVSNHALRIQNGNLNIVDKDVVLSTSTGTKIGTATTQKLAFYNSTPIVQPSGNILTALSNLGLVATPSLPIGSLSGVSISSPLANQVLTYNGTNWINQAIPANVSANLFNYYNFI